MQISKELAGFTGGQADTLRKAVGKKKLDLMAEIKPQLIEGALANSDISRQKIELFWDQLQEFANYCFNKSHAACYALIAYWTAYLKAHYRSAFMAALMTSDKDDTDRLAILIGECHHAGIEVLAPDVNESFVEFAIVPGTNKIRFGMAAVKGVGEAIVEEVLAVRKQGKFTSIADFAKRMAGSKFNKKAWDSLIKTGAFDGFGHSRSDLLENLDKIQGYMSKCAKEALSGQSDLFAGLDMNDAPDIEIVPAKVQASQKEQLQWERELLGLYISAHPLDKYEQFLREKTVTLSEITELHDGKTMTVGGILTAVRDITTKKGDKMAFLTIEDKLGPFSVIVFPRTFEEVQEILTIDKVYMIEGRISAKDRDGNTAPPQIIANQITEITDEILAEFNPNFRKKKTPKGNYEEFLEANGAKKIGSKKTDAKKSASVIKFVDPLEEIQRAQAEKAKYEASLRQKIESAAGELTEARVAENKAEMAQAETQNATVKPTKSSKLYVRLIDATNQQKLMALRQICQNFPGDQAIILVLGEDSQKTAIKLPFQVDLAGDLLKNLKREFAEQDLIVR